MVKYAFDEEVEDDSLGPDDTFEYTQTQKPRNQMPGSFDTNIPDKEDEAYESVTEAQDESMQESSPSQSASPSPSPSAATMEYHDELVEIASSDSDSGIDIPEAQTWLEQLGQSALRYKVLNASRKRVKRKYTVHDLNDDLFERKPKFTSVKSSVASSTLQRQLGNEAKNYPPRFQARWSGENLLCGSNSDSSVRIVRMNSVESKQVADQCLKVQLAGTNFDLDNDVPFARATSVSAKSIVESVPISDRSIWTLASALFDDLPITLPSVSDVSRQAIIDSIRKKRVSQWLEQSVVEAVKADESRAASTSERIFAKMTGHQITEACVLALSNGDVRLATLLPLSGGDPNFREDLRNQLDDWKSRRSLPFINISYRVLYELMSGNTSISSGTGHADDELGGQDYNVSRNLDWKRAFGLRLWYEIYEEDSIQDAVAVYDAASDTQRPVIGDVLDAHYHLLKLYSDASYDIGQLLDPRTIPSRSYRNIWQLAAYLVDVTESATLSEDQFDQLCLQYVSELTELGHWEWSIFVALHIKEEVARISKVKAILSLNSTKLTDSLEAFLTQQLLIPKVWLLEAKALYARSQENHILESELLIAAGHYNEAHTTLLKHIAPECIISGSLERLSDLLKTFKGRESTIPDWSRGGQLYTDVVNTLTTGKINDAMVGRIETGLSQMTVSTFHQRVAKSEMIDLLLPFLMTPGDRSYKRAQILAGRCFNETK